MKLNRTFKIITVYLYLSIAVNAIISQELNVSNIKGIYTCPPTEEMPEYTQSIQAVQESMKILYEIDIPIVTNAINDKTMIFIGTKDKLKSKFPKNTDINSKATGEITITCNSKMITIAGNDQWSTIFAIYTFLEKLGIRYYQPYIHMAIFPKEKSLYIKPFVISQTPTFAYRNGSALMWKQTGSEVADCRKGLNPELFVKKNTGSDLWIDHTAGYLVPKLMFYDKHPEYYAMLRNGKRIAKDAFTDHRTPLCLSNPDVTSISIKRALGWIDKNRDKRYFMITYGDTGNWCQCPNCLKLDPKKEEYINRLMKWVNAIADAVGQKYPDKIITTFAYGGSDKPNTDINIAPNVNIIGSTGLGNIPFWDHARKHPDTLKSSFTKLEHWVEIIPNRYFVCEYLSNVYRAALVDTMQSRLKFYREQGVQGIFYTYGVPSNFRPVWRYLFAKMVWNVEQNPQDIADTFIDAYYGDASTNIKEIFNAYHQQYVKTLKNNDDLVRMYPQNYYTDNFVNTILSLFKKAEAAIQEKSGKLYKEIIMEESLFIDDLLVHLPDYTFTTKTTQKLQIYLTRSRNIAIQSETSADFLRKITRFRFFLEKHDSRYHDWLNIWLGKQSYMKPIKIANGLQFPPESFLDVDYGPDTYTSKLSNPKVPTPPKFCIGIKTMLKNHPRVQNRARAYIKFDLDKDQTNTLSILELEGQDAVNRWAHTSRMMEKYADDMQIMLNGHQIFRGPCGFVRGNWSRRQFPIPPNTLKEKDNILEIYNLTRNSWPLVTAIILISDTKLIKAP